MFVIVDIAARTAALAEPDVFTAFHVVAAPADAPVAAVVDVLGADGGPGSDDDHVEVSVEAVRRWADSSDDGWAASFAGMLGYAESKGWLNDNGTMIAAHIER